MTERTP
jgi:hypothetical protein